MIAQCGVLVSEVRTCIKVLFLFSLIVVFVGVALLHHALLRHYTDLYTILSTDAVENDVEL